LTNLGHHIDKLTVRNILRRHHTWPLLRNGGRRAWARRNC
jgi:hypothetical protein